MYRAAMIWGTLFAGLAVVLGAFGAHALKEILEPAQQQTFETAVKYQFYHSFALLVTGIIHQYRPVKLVRMATLFFIIGIILFSGSLYLLIQLKMSGQVGLGGFGLLTPLGGLCFIVAWFMLLITFLKKQ